MSSIADTIAPPARLDVVPRLALAAAITVLGDWLFFGHRLGISVALFLAALAAGTALANRGRAGTREQLIAAGILVAGLLPLVENVGVLSLLSGIGGTGLFAVVICGALRTGVRDAIAATIGLLLAGPFQLTPDLAVRWRAMQHDGGWLQRDRILGWIVPLLLCAVFAALFASANPLIEQWLTALAPSRPLSVQDFWRSVLWAALISVAWAFVAVRLRAAPPAEGIMAGIEIRKLELGGPVFGDAAVLRSLVLFNFLFAIQTLLDAMYLWGGVALPAGMTYATYAHRGAYPLIATALLAALFILVAMRPGGSGERSPAIRMLVFVWIGQNVLLVVSSMLRLELYVAVYSLTLLRVAAFVWMLLVAVGLILIVARIALRRSNEWLVGANFAALALTLYVCSFVNFAGLVGEFNARNADGSNGSGAFDWTYALELGPQAIPALDRVIAAHGVSPVNSVVLSRDHMARGHACRMADWRAWTFRDWRLQRYLDKQARAMAASGGPQWTIAC
jgi:hypothetical protein